MQTNIVPVSVFPCTANVLYIRSITLGPPPSFFYQLENVTEVEKTREVPNPDYVPESVDADGNVMILDPQYMSIFGTQATEGTLRISLYTIVNQTRKQFGLSEIEMTSHFGKLPLSEAETSTVLSMRDLREGQERISIKRTKGGKLHVGQEKIVEADDSNFAEKITELMKDDFADVQLVKRNGKVVNVKQTKSELFKN